MKTGMFSPILGVLLLGLEFYKPRVDNTFGSKEPLINIGVGVRNFSFLNRIRPPPFCFT